MSVTKMNMNEPYERPFLNKPFFFRGCFLLGVIFILASTDKILLPAAFAHAVYNYQIFRTDLSISLPLSCPGWRFSWASCLFLDFGFPEQL